MIAAMARGVAWNRCPGSGPGSSLLPSPSCATLWLRVYMSTLATLQRRGGAKRQLRSKSRLCLRDQWVPLEPPHHFACRRGRSGGLGRLDSPSIGWLLPEHTTPSTKAIVDTKQSCGLQRRRSQRRAFSHSGEVLLKPLFTRGLVVSQSLGMTSMTLWRMKASHSIATNALLRPPCGFRW